MKKLKTIIVNHKKLSIFFAIYVIFLVYYARLPDYETKHSFITSSSNYIETNLDVQVYKAFNNKYLYKEIEEDHNRINRKPNKLVIDLYFFKWKYKTVIFDYDENLYYIKLDY